MTVPAANVDALADGNATVTASVNDVAGNPTSVSRVALVDATPPVVTINPVATDNVINTPEHTQRKSSAARSPARRRAILSPLR